MRTQKLLMVLFVIFTGFSASTVKAQVVFGYDAAGNQIFRERVIDMSANNYAINEKRLSETKYEDILKGMKITIYPNPTKGIVRIDISGMQIPENASIRIYNLQGVMLSQVENIGESNLVDLSSQPIGIYVMRIIIEKGRVSAWKIIKE